MMRSSSITCVLRWADGRIRLCSAVRSQRFQSKRPFPTSKRRSKQGSGAIMRLLHFKRNLSFFVLSLISLLEVSALAFQPVEGEGQKGAAFIVASPNLVPPGTGRGTTTIRWNTKGPVGQVYVSVNNGPEKLFAEATSAGEQEARWISVGPTYEFRLYKGTKREELLAAVKVTRMSSPGSSQGGTEAFGIDRGLLSLVFLLITLFLCALFSIVKGRRSRNRCPYPAAETELSGDQETDQPKKIPSH